MKINGIYRNGKIELAELPPNISEAVVSIIFYPDISLSEFGIDKKNVSELREKFSAFTDWENAEMDVYNDYDLAKTNLAENGAK
ncbi:MAG: hypothetical protein ACR2GD_08045 [Pyrinomonadaceae bacterium]